MCKCCKELRKRHAKTREMQEGKQQGKKQAMDTIDNDEGTDAFAAAFGIETFDDDFTFKDHPTDWRRKPWQR